MIITIELKSAEEISGVLQGIRAQERAVDHCIDSVVNSAFMRMLRQIEQRIKESWELGINW